MRSTAKEDGKEEAETPSHCESDHSPTCSVEEDSRTSTEQTTIEEHYTELDEPQGTDLHQLEGEGRLGEADQQLASHD